MRCSCPHGSRGCSASTARAWKPACGSADATGAAVFERDPDAPRPTASAIKSFYLVELFARFADALDRPLPGVEGVLADDAHPAISHFTPEQRAEIRRELNGATVRRVGLVMMGTAPASNVVYNAAANVTTAVLGGPDALTALIRKRDAAFAAVSARRYMLRNRRERGDNEAPAIALAALYQRLAARRLAGIEAPAMDAIHEALRRRDDPARRPALRQGRQPRLGSAERGARRLVRDRDRAAGLRRDDDAAHPGPGRPRGVQPAAGEDRRGAHAGDRRGRVGRDALVSRPGHQLRPSRRL